MISGNQLQMLGCQSPKFRDKVETNTHNKVLTIEQVLHRFLCKGISKEHLEDKETLPSILLPLWIELSHFGNMRYRAGFSLLIVTMLC